MKHLRLRDVMGLVLLMHELRLAVLNIVHHAVRGRGPFGFGRLRGLLMGTWRSFELDVDERRAMYRQRYRAIATASQPLSKGAVLGTTSE